MNSPEISNPHPAHRYPWTVLLLALAVSTGWSATPRPRPNILILLADDLGAMDIGISNPRTFYETPNLDRLAREGARFPAGYAANPVCSPTRFALMTGKYPTRAGLTDWLVGRRVERFQGAELASEMPLGAVTIAEALQPAGYRTAFVGKWHLGGTEEFWPERQGFEINVGGYARGSPNSYFSPYGNPRLADGPQGEHLTARLADESIRLLERFSREGQPFLLCHSFYAVHNPMQAPADLVAKYKDKAARLGLQDQFSEEAQYHVSAKGPRRVRTSQSHATYAALIEAMDTAAGRILDALARLDLAANTLVIFTSDNGGLSTAEGLPTSNLPLRGGKGWVYEGGIREPFFVRWPGVTRAGSVVADPVMTTDIMPTALAAAGVIAPANLDGRDLGPLFRGGGFPTRDLFWHYPHYSNQGGFPGGAIRSGSWKLIENYEDGSVALYELSNDETERNDLALATESTPRVRELRDRLHAWYRETGAKFLRARSGGPDPWHP